ncbi:MAG: MerC domain-containing protein [Wenzhouxiangella sp.]|jgi:hypothetical protein|nr:MerC domain-containing protein [Wenzhouxiangella sp.]
MIQGIWADRFGMIAAALCAVHCATLTALFLIYPALWLNRHYWEIGLWQKLLWLEWTLLTLAWVLVAVAMVSGWRRHGRRGPGLLGLTAVASMSLLILTPLHFSGYWTGLAALVAGVGLVLAHAWNARLIRSANPTV